MSRVDLWKSEASDAGTWFALDDDGTLWWNRTLPPALVPADEPGVRMPRSEGIGANLSVEELEALTRMASWALFRKREAASE